MSETNNNAPENAGGNNGNANTNSNGKDKDGNEITPRAKFFSGLFLIVLTAFSGLYLIGHWPDRLATPTEHIKPLYTYEWFHVRLVDSIIDSGKITYTNNGAIVEKAGPVSPPPGLDTPQKEKTDTSHTSAGQNPPVGSSDKASEGKKEPQQPPEVKQVQSAKFAAGPEDELMNINTLLLILVATAGFLGNMIYIATSFTTFIGNGQFKKSWTLWYYIKPFTAAGLALAIYFVFRGGFLNMSDDSTNINLYGLMTISIMAGLFTDRTTLKLKEVFDVLLRPSEERKDALVDKPEFTGVTSQPLEVGKASTIVINGRNFDKKQTAVKIEGQAIATVDKKPSAMSFSYTLPPELKDKDSVKLEVVDDKGTSLYTNEVKIKKGG